MINKARRIKKGYILITNLGKVRMGDYVSYYGGLWQEAYGLVGTRIDTAVDDGWRICRKKA